LVFDFCGSTEGSFDISQPAKDGKTTMYLAQQTINGINHWFIRESYAKDSSLMSRTLFELGPDPGRFIIYPGGHAYYIDEKIGDRLDKLNVSYQADDLDDLFFPFLDPGIKWRLEWVAHRKPQRKPSFQRRKTGSSRPAGHLFDKRRLHFLKYGTMRQGSLNRMPETWLKVLDAKSRDEIEQYFMRMEAQLKPNEFKSYVFVTFDLQRHFSEHFARTTPQMLDPEKMDTCLLREACRLNKSKSFWRGLAVGNYLHPYLVRYIVMYFDHDYAQNGMLDDVIRRFMASRRRYHPPRSIAVKMKHAADIFGTEPAVLKRMNRTELARLFRQRAQKVHPDKGGNHNQFVELTETYHALLRGKS